ncbi:MAG TPA: GDP-mannose 4,6-dehydratase [Candidatus Nanoarchaeia archaeon]|nr:GDP-mannose 4,6-dehydratase [Candidatus Nanoarchaeia archaeon]
MENKKALITGITGQIGSYLAELLMEKGYEVYGLVRRTSLVNARERIEHIDGIKLIYADLGDSSSINHLIQEIKPDEIYNLAAQSHVWVSFKMPEYTSDIDALGAMRICEAVRMLGKPVKIYQASTSELYGGIYNFPVNEETPFHPKSPYGVAKLYAYWIMRNYREAYKMFCSNGIVFNTESPRRGENFVTRKITKGVADILRGKQKQLRLGNLNARRDWGHAKDVTLAMWKILQYDKADDFVIATGVSHSVREFVELAFKHVGIEIKWRGEGVNEVGYDAATEKTLVVVDPLYFRPSEVEVLIGDATKAKNLLKWEPHYAFEEVVREMMEHDLK